MDIILLMGRIDQHNRAKKRKLLFSLYYPTNNGISPNVNLKCGMTQVGRRLWNHCRGNLWDRVKKRDRETVAAEMLQVFKLNYHRNVTLLHTTLNFPQMMCVMTCSVERGIHQETIESIQKNTQLQETSLTQTAGMGETFQRIACSENIYHWVTGELWKWRLN